MSYIREFAWKEETFHSCSQVKYDFYAILDRLNGWTAYDVDFDREVAPLFPLFDQRWNQGKKIKVKDSLVARLFVYCYSQDYEISPDARHMVKLAKDACLHDLFGLPDK